MMYPSIHHAARRIPLRIPLLLAFLLCLAAGAAFAAEIGDQVELKATNRAGVPLHQEPRGTNDFQRIPDGARAQVIDVAQGGQWLKLSLPDGRTGWVTSRYVSSLTTSVPSPDLSHLTSPPPQRPPNALKKALLSAWPTATPSPSSRRTKPSSASEWWA
jgi:hypothetical protein